MHPRHVLEALAQRLLGLLTRCDVVEAIDGSGDISAFVLKRPDIHDDGNPRAIWPLDEHFAVTRLRPACRQSLPPSGHSSCGMSRAVRTEQLEGATEALVRISQDRFAAPQFHRATIEFLKSNDASGIAGIDRDRAKI